MWKLLHGLILLRLCPPSNTPYQRAWSRSCIHDAWSRRANITAPRIFVCYYLRLWHYHGPGFNQPPLRTQQSAARTRTVPPIDAITSRYETLSLSLSIIIICCLITNII